MKISLLLCMFVGAALASSAQNQLFKRADSVLMDERVLQTTTVGYEIKDQEDVKKFCGDNNDQDLKKMREPEDLDKKREGMAQRYTGIYDTVIMAINGQTTVETQTVGREAFKSLAIFAIIMAVLSLGSSVFLIVWFIFSCCCKKTCCVPAKRQDQNKTCLNIIVWSGIVIALVAVILTVIWIVYMGRMANKANMITCVLAVLKSDFINGVQVKKVNQPNTYFIGSNGLTFTADKFIGILNSMAAIKQSAIDVSNQNLKAKAQQSESSFNSFNSTLASSLPTYEYQGTQNALAKIKIASVNVLSSQIAAITVEITQFKDAANQIADLAKVITDYNDNGDQIESAKANFENFKGVLREQITDRFTDIFNMVTGENGRIGTQQVKRTAMTSLIVSAIVIVIPLVLYIAILLLNHYNKCHCLKFVNKIIMLIQILFATIVFAYATVMVVVSIGMVIACRLMAKISTEHRYLRNTIPRLENSIFLDLIDECLGPQGQGQILRVLGVELGSFNQQESMSKGTLAFEGIKERLSQDDPPVSGAFRSTIVDFRDLKNQDGPGTDVNEIHKGIERVNTNACALDIMRYKDQCLATPKSSALDTNVAGLPAAFCFDLSVYGPSYNLRYTASSSSCSGPSSPTAVQGEDELVRTLASVTNYKSEMNRFLNNYDSGFFNDQKTLFTALKSSVTQLTTIATNLDASVKLFQKFGNSIPSITDCSFLRNELRGIENVLCYEVGDSFFKQNGLALAVGTFLFFYAWCICCGVRCTVEDDKEKEPKGQQYETPATKYEYR